MSKVPSIFLNGHDIRLVEEHKYLGVIISMSLKDDADMSKVICGLYARGNSIIRSFSKCSIDVKSQLFKSYCSNFYGSHLWCNFNINSLNRIKVAYNRVFRILMALHHRISMSFTFLNYGIDHFNVIYRKSITGFIKRVESSCNGMVAEIISSCFYTSSSLYKHWLNTIY